MKNTELYFKLDYNDLNNPESSFSADNDSLGVKDRKENDVKNTDYFKSDYNALNNPETSMSKIEEGEEYSSQFFENKPQKKPIRRDSNSPCLNQG